MKTTNSFKKPIRPIEAFKAMNALLQDKEDTAQVFRIIRALSGGGPERQFRNFCAEPMGRKILAEKRSLLETLQDREALAANPDGSLGRAYLDFVVQEELSADGLVDASKDGALEDYDGLDEDRLLYQLRLRDMHDLWHVVTGYGRDPVGELSLLAFTYAQEKNRGIGFIVLMAIRRLSAELPGVPVFQCVREGYKIGRRAEWLPAADWEALLKEPLDGVRSQLGVSPPDTYKAFEPRIQELVAERKAAANTYPDTNPGDAELSAA